MFLFGDILLWKVILNEEKKKVSPIPGNQKINSTSILEVLEKCLQGNCIDKFTRKYLEPGATFFAP